MRVLISSTSEDLKPHRAAVAEVIRAAQWEAVGMEDFPASPLTTIDLCRERVSNCQVVILLQAWRYGWVPEPEDGGDGHSSITALEVAHAKKLGLDTLCFLADDNWPGRLWDDDPAARARAKGFRSGLNQNARFFRWEDDPKLPVFKALISEQLANFRMGLTVMSKQAAALPAVSLLRTRVVPVPPQPYPILGPYEHPETLAGRDAEIDTLASLVGLSPLVLCIHAASGAGKSSLLLAGLAPCLRDRGYTVSVERTPGDPRLAQRLLKDILEPGEAIGVEDSDPDLPAAFARWVAEAHCQSGKPIVFVLDQIDDVLRDPARRGAALARIGPLLAATAQRLPGVQAFPCKWVLSYRHEFHGEVREWLEDVLAQARAAKRPGIESLPYDLSDTQKWHDWVVPVFGRLTRSGGIETARAAFLSAILRPLGLKNDDGHAAYPYRLSAEDAGRLATAFAEARGRQPDAPLVPELQVVLGHLLHEGRESAGPVGAGVSIDILVPAPDQLEAEIQSALTDHVARALDSAFPGDRRSSSGISSRTLALLALGRLVDGEGRRAAGLPADDLARQLGSDGQRVLARLSAPDTRLLMADERGTYGVSHDQLAKVLAAIIKDERSRGNLLLDQRLLDLQRTIGQKVALYAGNQTDESALTLTPEQRQRIAQNEDALLFDQERRLWWNASKQVLATAVSARNRRWAAVAAMLVVVAAVGAWSVMTVRQEQRSRQLLVFKNDLQQKLRVTDRPGATLDALAGLASHSPVAWNDLPEGLDADIVESIDQRVFTEAPWERAGADTGLLPVIRQGYTAFVRSRTLFGAMSFALEEVWLRSSDPVVRADADALAQTVRDAFIAYHLANTPKFEKPPEAAADRWNPWISLAPGTFDMGATDSFYDEQPEHRVDVSAFSMQQHEVTNREYARFDPAHEFDPWEEELLPVTSVSWYEAAGYAAWLGASLPTEAQWEYAAGGTGASVRGGRRRRYPWSDAEPSHDRAVYSGTAGDYESPLPVDPPRTGGRTPEGLDDMAGNAWEWCRDWFGAYVMWNPLGPLAQGADTTQGARMRVLRGGSFDLDASFLRAAFRYRGRPDDRYNNIGFRVVSSRLRP